MSHKQLPAQSVGAEQRQLCVYTTLIGRYEGLNEQPVAARSALPFICLTDDQDLKSETWEIRNVRTVFGMDPIRSQRDFKLRPHLHLAEFDVSLYIDNSVLLTVPPENLCQRHFPASGFCLPEHSFRDSVLDEFLEVARLGLDDQSRVFEQLNHCMIDFPDVLKEKPYWTAILLRDHKNPAVREMLEIWAAHVNRYSRRDQLSVNAAFRQAGLTPDVMRIDNNVSWFHSWPHIKGRNSERRMSGSVTSMMPQVARIRQLEQTLGELRQRERTLVEQARQHEAFRASASWRLATGLSNYAHRHPHLARLVRRGLEFCCACFTPKNQN